MVKAGEVVRGADREAGGTLDAETERRMVRAFRAVLRPRLEGGVGSRIAR